MPKSLRRPSGWIAASVLTVLALVLASYDAGAGEHLRRPAGRAPSPPPTSSAPSRARSAASSRRRTTAARRSTTSCPARSTTATWTSSTASAATSSRATSRSSQHYRLQVRRHDPHRRRRSRRIAIFARFQQRNRERINYAIALLKTEPDWTLERDLRVRPREGALAGDRRPS